MKKIITLISLSLLFIAMTTDLKAESSSKPNKETINTQQKTGSNQRDSDQPPIVVKIIKAPNHKVETDKEAKTQEEKTSNDERLIQVTAVLAFIALLQLFVFAWQAHRLRQTVEATKEAADAAKRSADALPAIERAYIFVTVDIPEINPSQDGTIPSMANFRLYNHGKTPAILKKVHFIIKLRDAYPTITEINSSPNPPIPDGIIISSNDSRVFDYTVIINTREWEQVDRHKIKLLCYGSIDYEDVFKESHITGFCWEYYPRTVRTGISENQELNYYT